jgi:hypothetical protein
MSTCTHIYERERERLIWERAREINTWPFPYQLGIIPCQPDDAIEGWYGSRNDSRDDMEKVLFLIFCFLSYISDKLLYEENKKNNEIIKWLYTEV